MATISASVDRRNQNKQPRESRGSERATPTSATQFSVYINGTDRAGAIRRDGPSTFSAFNRLGKPIGVFGTQTAACDAVEREASRP